MGAPNIFTKSGPAPYKKNTNSTIFDTYMYGVAIFAKCTMIVIVVNMNIIFLICIVGNFQHIRLPKAECKKCSVVRDTTMDSLIKYNYWPGNPNIGGGE